MPWTNFHSHNNFCDGTETPESYIISAIAQNLPAFGYSSHAPVSFATNWCIADNKFDAYLNEIKDIKLRFKSKIQTYLGLEIDFIPGIAGRSLHLLKDVKLDYFIGSIHFVDSFKDGTPWNIDNTQELFDKGLKEIYNNKFEKASERFYELTLQMIVEDKPDIIGHLDKIKMYNAGNRYFNESETFYQKQVNNILRIIKKSGVIVEVNTRGYYRYGQLDLYPSQWILENIAKMDIPVMLNSDSHKPEEITAGFLYASKKLKIAGVKRLWAMIDSHWEAYEFNENGLIL